MEDASTFLPEILLSFAPNPELSPNPELYLLSGFDRCLSLQLATGSRPMGRNSCRPQAGPGAAGLARQPEIGDPESPGGV